MATEKLVDVNELVRLLRIQARQEVEQTRINLDRELLEWKARYGRVSSKYAKLRMHNRALREAVRKNEQERAAARDINKYPAGSIGASLASVRGAG